MSVRRGLPTPPPGRPEVSPPGPTRSGPTRSAGPPPDRSPSPLIGPFVENRSVPFLAVPFLALVLFLALYVTDTNWDR